MYLLCGLLYWPALTLYVGLVQWVNILNWADINVIVINYEYYMDRFLWRLYCYVTNHDFLCVLL